MEDQQKTTYRNTQELRNVIFKQGKSAIERMAFAFGYLERDINSIPQRRIRQLKAALKEANY